MFGSLFRYASGLLLISSLPFLGGCVSSYFSESDLRKFRTEAEITYPKSTSYAELLTRLTEKYGSQEHKIFSMFEEFTVGPDTIRKTEESGMTKFRGDPDAAKKGIWEKRGDYNWWVFVQLRVYAYYFFDENSQLLDTEVNQEAYGP